MNTEPGETSQAVPDRTFFDEIVGLRFYLALWVAIGHGLQLSGFHKKDNAILDLVMDGHSAVILFMIISGFVITNLITLKAEPYPAYIVRRYLRLFPAFLACGVLGWFLVDDWTLIAREASWREMPNWASYARDVEAFAWQTQHNTLAHALLHLVMLHGAIPEQILGSASLTFLPAAWSISLEWQFYLVAPLALAAIRNQVHLCIAAAITLVLLLFYKAGLFGEFASTSFLAGTSFWFVLGIASRLAFERLRDLVSGGGLLATVLLIWTFLIGTGGEILATLIWVAFYGMMLWQDRTSILARAFGGLTRYKPIMLLGEASYSLYLVHRPLQVWIGSYLVEHHAVGRGGMLAGQIAAILVAIPLSIGLYLTIEKWGVTTGRRLAKRMTPARLPPERPLHA